MPVLLRRSNLLAEWEEFMASISHELRIKYGLGNDPSPDRVQEWVRLTNQYIREGRGREDAGEAAAKFLFPDYRTHFYASQADTVSYLLEQAGRKK